MHQSIKKNSIYIGVEIVFKEIKLARARWGLILATTIPIIMVDKIKEKLRDTAKPEHKKIEIKVSKFLTSKLRTLKIQKEKIKPKIKPNSKAPPISVKICDNIGKSDIDSVAPR